MSSRTRFISYGKCFLCGGTFAKNGISRHLKKCLATHESDKGKKVRMYHLRAEGRYNPAYWLNLEIPASATLGDLDSFLRAIWLECCDHLSAFTIDNVSYELDTGMVDAMWKGFFGPLNPTRSMNVKLYQVLSVGKTFSYEYDFGTTTELKLKMVGERKGNLPAERLRVLARNYAPAVSCIKCDKPARWVHTWGGYEPYCKAHARKHKDSMDGFLPIVNSPRVGDCGYTGPYDEALRFEETAPA